MDHKNTKELSPIVYNDAINAITMVVVLECKNGNLIDYVKVEKILKEVNQELAQTVLTKVKRIDFFDDECMFRLLSKSMVARMSHIYKSRDNKIVERYLKSS